MTITAAVAAKVAPTKSERARAILIESDAHLAVNAVQLF
jgi:hypothetical protein